MLATAPGATEVELAIGGMTCAACAARVQAKLNKVEGVTATVNLSTERAHITAPAHVSASEPGRRGRGGRLLRRPGPVGALAVAESASLASAEYFAALPGLGARGVVDGHEVVVGRSRLFADRGVEVSADLAGWCRAREQAGCTAVLVSWDDTIRGALAVTNTVKPSAAAAVAGLRGLGLRPVLLTGDNAATAQAVAAAAGIEEVISEALPAAKARVITDLQVQGRSVAMVGDGVNDGPALAAAQLGLALGSGTDVAICAADMILLRDDLEVVPDAIRLARATFRTIRRNLAWAFCYNVLAIPLAALGFLNPIVAAATMTLSSVFVVWNSLRLRRFAR